MEINSNFTIGSLSNALGETSTTSNTDLGMEDFLEILAASLQNPSLSTDGSSGSDSSMDYLDQMIQFTTIEQLQDLSTSMQTTMLMSQQQQALSLIGKEVTVAGEEAMVTGTVDKVTFTDGYAKLEVNSQTYSMNDIQAVSGQG